MGQRVRERERGRAVEAFALARSSSLGRSLGHSAKFALSLRVGELVLFLSQMLWLPKRDSSASQTLFSIKTDANQRLLPISSEQEALVLVELVEASRVACCDAFGVWRAAICACAQI